MPVLFVLFFPEGDERLIAFFFAVLVAMSKCIHDATHSGGRMTFILSENSESEKGLGGCSGALTAKSPKGSPTWVIDSAHTRSQQRPGPIANPGTLRTHFDKKMGSNTLD